MKSNKYLFKIKNHFCQFFFICFLLFTAESVYSENLYDFINIIKPFVLNEIGFENITPTIAEKQLKNFTGFTCQRTNYSNMTTKMVCYSDKTFSGAYRIFLDFNNTGKINFIEIQASHPELEKKLARSSFGLDYYAETFWRKIEKSNFINKTNSVLFSNLSEIVFSTKISGIHRCMEVNEQCVLCAAYKVKENNSGRNMFLISLSEENYFNSAHAHIKIEYK